ncbi:MAG: NrfD/PsrC family molybdoenzyme membrane anchor subunit, partial [Terriglobales bacterium]
VLGVSTYLTGCILYFYIPMIPDLALLAERTEFKPWRRRLYRRLALGWSGTEAQKRLLERAISAMAVFIIPLAVSVHTVVSWIFAMTLRPGWDSSIFGPYFVVGAIYSGAAAVIFSMYVLRRVYRLQDYIQPMHFRKLGLMLLAFSLLYLYFNINEYLTAGYKLQGMERTLLDRLFVGDYAFTFWTAQSICVFIPLLIMIAVLGLKRYEQFTIPGIVFASGLVVVGAWAKRYIIIVPTLRSPFLPSGQRLPWEWTHYNPTWVEWSITAAAVAGFLMIYTLLSKLFPVVSIWETREQPAVETEAVAVPDGSRWWKAGAATTGLLVALLIGTSVSARAAGSPPAKTPKPTAISVEWKALPATTVPATGEEEQKSAGSEPQRVYWYAGRVFNPFSFLQGASRPAEENTVRPLSIVATLHDASGAPLGFKPVEFAVQTGFGPLSFGTRPTMGDGRAQLTLRDRRFGSYPVTVTFKGDDEFAAATFQVPVNFGERPAPALPHIGVLITPYATAAIAVPFLLFYGAMWVVFAYAFGYLIAWRMRKQS